jgi:hypothetical protein
LIELWTLTDGGPTALVTTSRGQLDERRLHWFRLREHGAILIPAFELHKLISPELARVADLATAATSEEPVEAA